MRGFPDKACTHCVAGQARAKEQRDREAVLAAQEALAAKKAAAEAEAKAAAAKKVADAEAAKLAREQEAERQNQKV